MHAHAEEILPCAKNAFQCFKSVSVATSERHWCRLQPPDLEIRGTLLCLGENSLRETMNTVQSLANDDQNRHMRLYQTGSIKQNAPRHHEQNREQARVEPTFFLEADGYPHSTDGDVYVFQRSARSEWSDFYFAWQSVMPLCR